MRVTTNKALGYPPRGHLALLGCTPCVRCGYDLPESVTRTGCTPLCASCDVLLYGPRWGYVRRDSEGEP